MNHPLEKDFMMRIVLMLFVVGLTAQLNRCAAESPQQKHAIPDDRQVSIEVRFIAPSAELLRSMKLSNATVVPDNASEEKKVDEPKEIVDDVNGSPIRLANATTVVERRIPLSVQVVPHKSLTDFFTAVQSDKQTNVQVPPKLTVRNGAIGEIDTATHRPFVTNLKSISSAPLGRDVDDLGQPAITTGFQPVIRTVRDGITLKVRPQLLEKGRVSLNLLLQLDEVRDVQAAPVAASAFVQIPEVKKTQVELTARLQSGETLVIRNADSPPKSPKRTGLWKWETPAEADKFPLIVLVSAHEIDEVKK